ncbi:MAG TPA: nitroreductase family protein, partial [Actinobacteria bacterium]|nr:nitroreductase family protein [Actinomycetota bacterium]
MNHLTLSPEAQDLLFREARTANAFTDEPVTDEQMAAIYDLVKYGPTAMNTQPLRILLVREDARERLLKHMSDGNRDKTASAPLVAVLAADTDFHEHLHRTFPHFPGAKDA